MNCIDEILELLKQRERFFATVRDFMAADDKNVVALMNLPDECTDSFRQVGNNLIKGPAVHEGWEYELQVLLRAMARREQADVDDFISRALLSKKTIDKTTYVTYLSGFEGGTAIAALLKFATSHAASAGAYEEAIVGALQTLQQWGVKDPLEGVAELMESRSAQVRSAALALVASADKRLLLSACKRLLPREKDRGIILQWIDVLTGMHDPEASKCMQNLRGRRSLAQDSEIRMKIEQAGK